MIIWKPCIDRIREATATPRLVMAQLIRKLSNSTPQSSGRTTTPPPAAPATAGSPTEGSPRWRRQQDLAGRHRPSAGPAATNTSFKKPNSRSQIIDMAEKIDVNSTLMPMTPGYMNRR